MSRPFPMFKWLEKVIAGKAAEATSESAPAVAVPQPVAPSAAPGRPDEPPLRAPTITLTDENPNDPFARGILSRQVIVDRAYHPVAYEFGLRTDDATLGGIPSVQILAGVLKRLGNPELNAGRRTWFRLADSELCESLSVALDHSQTVLSIELSPTGQHDMHSALAIARRLKAEGFQFALANWQDTEQHHAWLPLCDFVEIRNTTHNPVDLGSWPDKIAALAPGVALVACDVDSWEELEFCHRQNYQLFRGHFLTHRENWPRQPKINPERTRLIDLLNRLHMGAELAEIGDQLKQSPELSYRLLRYINSAGMGSGTRIASIQQGLMVLGRDKIYRWLTVLMFTSGQGKSLDSALLEQALVRARLMELLAGERFNRVQTDEIFVLGIFSLLDMLLRLPMSVAIEALKLPPAVEHALLDNDTGESDYAPLLKLAIACEDGDREQLKTIAARLGIPIVIINSLHLDALVWTQQTLAEK